MPLRSMTGHGVGEAEVGRGRIVVEVRAVNHRFLDLRVKLPPELAELSGVVEQHVRALLDRGRVELSVRVEGDALGAPRLDETKARAAMAALTTLRDALAPGEPVPLSLLALVPELFVPSGVARSEGTREALLAALDRATAELSSMRAREGHALAEDFRARLNRVGQVLADIRVFVPESAEAWRKRLTERVAALLVAHPLDAARLEHEVVLFADRADVTEELTRLASHVDHLGTLLESDSPQAGRRIDFLLQEMAREANTLGAKSADARIARGVVELKTELERMREQAQNVL